MVKDLKSKTKNDNMKILFVLEYFPPHIGGVETLFDNITRGLVERGDEVTVLTTKVPGSSPYEISEGRKIYRIGTPFRHAFALSFRKAAKLAEEADLIHTTTYVATGTTWLARKLAKKPVVATFHEVWGRLFFEFQNPITANINYLLEALMCRAYKNTALTCPSEATKRAMVEKGMNEENIHVIPHGINHKIFNRSMKPMRGWDGPTYMAFGRAGISKGIEYLVQAVPEITKAIPDSKLLLMLSRKERYNKIISMVRKLGIEKNVVFLQPQSTRAGVAGMIRSSDVVVVPSISEGFGFNAVEAQACGIPVVASNVASLPEVVKGGVLVEPRNPSKIAEAVIMLLKDKRLRERMGKKGSDHAKTYQWKTSVGSYIKLYEKILA